LPSFQRAAGWLSVRLFREYQFSLARDLQPITRALVVDEQLVAGGKQLAAIEASAACAESSKTGFRCGLFFVKF